MARQFVQQAENGKAFLSPAAVEDENVARALRAYFAGQNGYLMLSPDAETRYLAKMGTQKGTVAGGHPLRHAIQVLQCRLLTANGWPRAHLAHRPNIRGAGIHGAAMTNALDSEKSAEVGDDLFRLTYGNLPGNNLFYIKPVMDYLFMWNLNESKNPGAMARMERNAAKHGQEFFISPTARVAEQQASGSY